MGTPTRHYRPIATAMAVPVVPVAVPAVTAAVALVLAVGWLPTGSSGRGSALSLGYHWVLDELCK
jgi:hypothetical protein